MAGIVLINSFVEKSFLATCTVSRIEEDLAAVTRASA
jgi:hypothetical protein